MAKFLLVYHGGSGMADTEEGHQKEMAAWGAWFGQLGASVVDGGNPTGASKTLDSTGSANDGGGANPATGYSLIDAGSLEEALTKAKGCPILGNGGSVEVCETIDVGP